MRRIAAISLYVLLTATWCLADPEPGSAPGYEHDKWVTKPSDIVRHFEAYTVSFDGADDDTGDGKPDYFRIPEWVAYEIKSYEGKLPKYARPSWFTDKELNKQGIAPSDASYRGEAERWNRGHMCMKNHATRVSKTADKNTHTLLNIVPQSALLNQHIWQDLEFRTADWADTFGQVWIICGPILKNHQPRMWIGKGNALKVAVPQAFFKIVVRENEEEPGRPHVLAFIYPNSESESVLSPKAPFHHEKFLTTVDDIEQQTGLDFLTVLDDNIEKQVESTKGQLNWE